MDRLSKTENILMARALRTPSGIEIGGVTSKLGLPLKSVAIAFRRLRKLGFLEQKGESLYLTKRGRSWIFENQQQFAFFERRVWREVPERFEAETIAPYKPYAPLRSKL